MQKQLTLSANQFVVLSIISLAQKSLAVSEIVEAAEKIGLKFSKQNMGNIVFRLNQENLVSFQMSAPRRMAGGFPHKLFSITKKGSHELETTSKFFQILLSMKSL